MLSWGNSKYGWLALLLFAIAESSFFPIPPDVLLIALCLGAPKKSLFYASVCLAGSLIGAVGGYLIGSYVWYTSVGEPTALANFFFSNVFSLEAFNSVGELYNKHNFWVIFTAGFTPLPYKVFTITAGVFQINFVMFIIASIISRGARFFIISGLIMHYGAPIKKFIDKYFNLLAIAFTVLLVGSFFLISQIGGH